MIKRLLSFVAILSVMATAAVGQIVTTSPAILQESNKNVVLTYHADAPQGNNGLKGLTASDPVYVHIGVITNLSNKEWVYGPNWGDNAAKYKMDFIAANTWKLELGDMRQYFGISNPAEHIEKIAIVFRNGACTKEGKTASGGDVFVDVFPEGFQMQFSTTASSTVISSARTLTFNAVTSAPASITISVNGTKIGGADNATQASASYSFSKTGSYTVTATASAGSESVTKKINIAYPGNSTAGTYPGGVPKMGTVRNSDGSVTFCIAAPDKKSVVMVPSWDDYEVLDKNIMKYQDYQGQRYFFITVDGLNDKDYYPYYYIVDATYKVADPYARLVLDPYSDRWLDSSVWPEMPKYPYDRFDDVMLAVYQAGLFGTDNFGWVDFTIPDHKTLTIYELLIRDFTGTDGKANAEGTFDTTRAKLWYLKSLGVNAIELMPVMEFNGNNSWGYNTNFYFAPDKAYGSPRALKNLINACHDLGMAVILDIVFNQSDGLHPWYQMYPSNNNPFYNATAPHAYSVLNDWKQENVLVQKQWEDALQMWLTEYNVDGFRFDLVKGLGTSYGSNTDAYNKSRVETMKRLHAAMKAVKPDAIHINENLAGAQEENEMAADGQLNWANKNDISCQYAMGYAERNNLESFLSTNDSRTAFSTVSYAESHDEERMGYKQIQYGHADIKSSLSARMNRLGSVAVQMLMTPGPKMIWQFGELGADETTKTSDGGNKTDPKIVVWNYLENSDRKALHDVYQAMCNLRTDNPELFGPDATFTPTGFSNSIATNRIMRLTNGQKEVMAFIATALKGSNKTVGATSTILNKSNSQLICSSTGFTPTLNGTGNSVSVSVPANGFAVFASTATTGVEDITGDGSGMVVVTGGHGCIHIEGEYDNVAVYNMQGQAKGLDGLSAGIYIVNVDGFTTKVVVR